MFNKDYLNAFLGVVRKYMQVKGGLSQRGLSELTDINVSTLSRFLNQKTKELDPQILANIVAKLEIPLHEIIDFIEEEQTAKFKKLIQFYREDTARSLQRPSQEKLQGDQFVERSIRERESELNQSGTAERRVNAHVRIGKNTTKIPFSSEHDDPNRPLSVKEKLEMLTPRQKAYISDFLKLDLEGKDLMVDLGNSLYRYFRQKGIDL